MVQADAPVFIILGVMAVLVGLVPVLGFVENFGTSSQETNVDQLNKLSNQIGSTCEQLDNYETVLTTKVDISLRSGATLTVDDKEVVLEDESEEIRELECTKNIDFNVEDSSEDKIQAGSSTASISGEDNTVVVEVE
ncbi:MAG: hypothetical protein R6V35_03165 [Candidatus Nanohaloarchaea archaeon]